VLRTHRIAVHQDVGDRFANPARYENLNGHVGYALLVDHREARFLSIVLGRLSHGLNSTSVLCSRMLGLLSYAIPNIFLFLNFCKMFMQKAGQRSERAPTRVGQAAPQPRGPSVPLGAVELCSLHKKQPHIPSRSPFVTDCLLSCRECMSSTRGGSRKFCMTRAWLRLPLSPPLKCPCRNGSPLFCQIERLRSFPAETHLCWT
jgi:hypothetical protein